MQVMQLEKQVKQLKET
jgi:platelet-activating factor acetylhydrolase IB subunit alpha